MQVSAVVQQVNCLTVMSQKYSCDDCVIIQLAALCMAKLMFEHQRKAF